MPAKKKAEACPNCGACKECGAGGQPQIVPMPYPVPQPYPVSPRPWPANPYRPQWISQPQTWGIGTNQASGGTYTQAINASNSLH